MNWYILPLILLVALILASSIRTYREWVFDKFGNYLNKLFHDADHRINRKEVSQHANWFNAKGHSPGLSVLVLGVLTFTIYGPTLSPLLALTDGDHWLGLFRGELRFLWNIGAFVLLLLLVAALGFFSKRYSGLNLQRLHVALVVVASAFVVTLPDSYFWNLFGDPRPAIHTEASGFPYSHIFAWLSLMFALVALLASRLIERFTVGTLMNDVDRKRIARHLLQWVSFDRDPFWSSRDLPEKEFSDSTPSRAFHAWLIVPFRQPILLLLFPSIAVLLSPPDFDSDQSVQILMLLYVGLGTMIFLAAGNYYDGWRMMTLLAQRRFSRGGSLLISLVIIVIAMCYLFDISYVTTVMHGISIAIFGYIIGAYMLVWLYDYWASRVATTAVMQLLGAHDNEVTDNHYPNDDWRRSFTVGNSDRTAELSLHGRSRYTITPPNEDASGSDTFLTPELFEKLKAAAPRTRAEGNQSSEGGSYVEDRDAIDLYRTVNRLWHNHLSSLHLILGVTAALVFYFAHTQPRVAMLSVDAFAPGLVEAIAGSSGNTDPTTRCATNYVDCVLFTGGDDPIIVVAASGGGTRAALYTTSLLYGLHQQGLADHVKLVSGVSGGGLALAYYVSNFDNLGSDDTGFDCPGEAIDGIPQDILTMQPPAWSCFFRSMSTPFISDVVKGAVESRIVGGLPNGQLLAESFSRHFGAGNVEFSRVRQPGLILNTTVTGHSRDASVRLRERFCESDDFSHCPPTDSDFVVHAGSRLVFTNMTPIANTFPERGEQEAPDVYLNYTVVADGKVTFPIAAALNANFPPVFSDVLINVKFADATDPRRYWITDGGAADNRGIVSLLYAVRHALGNMTNVRRAKIPDLHIVVAEASFSNIDYGPSRGMNVVLGSSAPFASQLMIELLDQIRSLANVLPTGEPSHIDKIHLHYVEMPRVFVSRSGFGTHWMLPEAISIMDPEKENYEEASENTVSISREELLSILVRMHNDPDEDCETRLCDIVSLGAVPDGLGQGPASWICNDAHRAAWTDLVTAVKASLNGDRVPAVARDSTRL